MATTHFITSLKVMLIELLEDLSLRRARLIEGDDCARVCPLVEPARRWDDIVVRKLKNHEVEEKRCFWMSSELEMVNE